MVNEARSLAGEGPVLCISLPYSKLYIPHHLYRKRASTIDKASGLCPRPKPVRHSGGPPSQFVQLLLLFHSIVKNPRHPFLPLIVLLRHNCNRFTSSIHHLFDILCPLFAYKHLWYKCPTPYPPLCPEAVHNSFKSPPATPRHTSFTMSSISRFLSSCLAPAISCIFHHLRFLLVHSFGYHSTPVLNSIRHIIQSR